MGLVLTHFDVSCFVDAYGKPVPFLIQTEEEWMGMMGRLGKGRGKEEGGKLWLVCKISENN